MRRQLVVNADDFGFTRDVNSGIIEAHRQGILTATTLMADGPAFQDAVRLARENPRLDVGVHLVLLGTPGLPASVPACVAAVYAGGMDPYGIFFRQVQKVVSAGIRPTHLDTHKHTHLLPRVFDAVCEIARRFAIPYVRLPAELPLPYRAPLSKRLTGRLMRLRLPAMRRHLAAGLIRHTDHFTGFAITGRFNAADLCAVIAALPAGSTELMVHPGHLGEELAQAGTRLKQSRADELAALTAPEVREALLRHGVELARYRDL